MSIGRILDGKGERLTKTRLARDPSPVSIPRGGNATAEASITRPWQPDPPNNSAPCGIRRESANGTSRESICCRVLRSALRFADVILSLPPSAFHNCDSPQLASDHRQNRSNYQFVTGYSSLGIAPTRI